MKKLIKRLASNVHAKMREKAGEKRFWSVFSAAVIIIVAVWVVAGTLKAGKLSFDWWTGGGLTVEQVKVQTEKFINDNLTNGRKAEIKSITEGGDGIYKLSVQIADTPNVIESYVTKDGKIFFPKAMPTDKNAAATNNGAAAKPQASAPKSVKPVVELFVMSYCPFGTQIEKGIIPAVQALGNTIDFKLKFVNYVMHQKKELDENTKQYCIGQIAPTKLLDYVGCFIDGTDAAQCIAKNGIDAGQVENCSAATDQKYGLSALYNDQSKWQNGFPLFPIYDAENAKYGVAGSPTLVINGVQVNSDARDSASLLKTICNTFTDKPVACSAKLSSVAPAAGIGTVSGNGAPASNASSGN
jgi:hypothetical protein